MQSLGDCKELRVGVDDDPAGVDVGLVGIAHQEVQHLCHAAADGRRAHVPQPTTTEGTAGAFGGVLESSSTIWAQQSSQTLDGTWGHDDLRGSATNTVRSPPFCGQAPSPFRSLATKGELPIGSDDLYRRRHYCRLRLVTILDSLRTTGGNRRSVADQVGSFFECSAVDAVSVDHVFRPSSGHLRCPACRSKNVCACGRSEQTEVGDMS